VQPADALLTIIFQFLPDVRLVTAHTASPADNQLLASLFPNDLGGLDQFELAVQLLGSDGAKTELPHMAKAFKYVAFPLPTE
jgi:hypothetical protein